MKIGILSDLHINFYTKIPNEISSFLIKNLLKEKIDLFICAGDIAEENIFIKKGLTALRNYFECPVIYVLGNHDFWDIQTWKKANGLILKSLKEGNPDIKAQLTKLLKNQSSLNKIIDLTNELKKEKDIYLLDGDTIKIKGITIGGTSGWYDFSGGPLNFLESLIYWKISSNDSFLIYMDETGFNPIKFYKKERKRVEKILKQNPDIIVTHIGPTIPEDLPDKFKTSPLLAYFYFEGKDLLDKYQPSYWIFGHSHLKHDFLYNKTRLICNPLGYPAEAKKQGRLPFKIEILEL